ncbi:MAG: HD domain-containing protein [Lachnospiraceae bacterium]|nr:HD domain-containing protein [Lachnospiraceae bacterium]
MGNEGVSSHNNIKKFKLLLIYLFFVLINIVINRCVKSMGSAMYMDNIGTLLAAVLGGYLPGIFVGYMTNIINSTADISNTYYAGISVLIAVSSTFLAKKGFFEKFWKSLVSIPVLALIGGGIGSVLTYFIYGPGENGFWKQMLLDLRIDFVDKALTVVIAYAIMKVLPNNISSMLVLTDWCQKPLTSKERKSARKTITRGMSLRKKIVVIISVIMIFIACVTTTISYILYRNFAIEQFKSTGRSVASLAATTIDPEMVDEYMEKGDSAEEYREVERSLYSIRSRSPYIEYIYVYQIREDGCHVVFDLDTDGVKGSEPGDVVPFDESFQEELPTLLAGEVIDPLITNDTFGWLLTDYEPVFNSKGQCVCYACADINMKDVTLNGISFLAKVISLFVGFFILILVLCMWFSEYHLTFPIDAMTSAAGEFVYSSEEALESSVEQLKEIRIATGDEIENLYQVLVKTMSDTVGYIEDVKAKGDQIALMQNGLIYIMADLVESRDKCTGDHVRKTAAYVRLILNLLREQNLFPDQITDEYIEDVCNSAPLHDVGKIKVSDLILNKPARLTDAEFEEMKKHTTAGQEIIESAMELTGGATGYLKEALNLAAYHHEKWDGSGYPYGLKGEEIPLSARIMAVSDVFDALVSARSYKKPFTFEQAMNIIEEGIGKHFDPVIAKIFVDHPEEVRKIAQENMKKTDS